MHERLKTIRNNTKLTQETFAASIGITRGMLSKYEIGRVPVPLATQMLICQKYNVSPEWLATGEGKPYKEGLIPELVHALRHMPDVQAALERLLPLMTVEDWEALNDALSRFIGKLK